MNIAMLLTAALIVVLLWLSLVPIYRAAVKGRRTRAKILFQLCGFFGILMLAWVTPLGDIIARAASGEVAPQMDGLAQGLGFLSAGLSMGMASLGAGIAVGGAAPAAVGAFSENPKAFGKALVFVVLGEGVALFGFLVSTQILGKL